MLPFYREITYRAWTLEFHEATLDHADALPGVDILLARTRPLGWLERDELFRDEYGCRVVLAIVGRDEDIVTALHRGRDPYRATFEEFVREVRPDVQELIDDIGADHREVTTGRLSFRTKSMSSDRAIGLGDRFVPFAEEMDVELELSRSTQGNTSIVDGRAHGSILGIHRLSYALLSSPFVVRQQLAVFFE